MTLLLNKCAEILECKVSALRDRLNHPIDRARVMDELQGRTAVTTYSEDGFTKTFVIGGLSRQGADKLMAYGSLVRPYAINVAGYYHCKFGIRLKYPFTCCLVERFPIGAEDRYFPLELVELLPKDEFSSPSTSNLPKWLGHNLYAELPKRDPWGSSSSAEDGGDNDISAGRDQLSQDPYHDPVEEMTW